MIRSQGHWTGLYYRQKITRKELKEYLLNEPQSVIYRGVTTPLLQKHLGAGVYELKKDLKHYKKLSRTDIVIPSWY